MNYKTHGKSWNLSSVKTIKVHLKFSATDYDKALGITEESHKLRKEFQEFVNSSQAAVARSSAQPYRGSVGSFSQRTLP